MKKRIIAIVAAIVVAAAFVGCSKKESSTEVKSATTAESKKSSAKSKQVTIGVSIWSSTDTLGSQCKRMLDEAAKALNVKLVYVDQAHISEQVTASAETLAAAGVDGMIICNSASAEMTSVINTCTQNQIYLAQFFRVIDPKSNPNEYALGQRSTYYLGAVHEDEVANGTNLVRILCEKGNRKIALEAWEAGDATFLGRWEGYKKGIENWNADHPDDQAVLLDPQYGGTTSDTGRATAEAIINSNPDIDALIVAGGGGDTLVGALAAIESMGKKGEIAVVSTDFLADLDKQLATGGMAAESGGHYADPLFAMMLVYNTITGKYTAASNSVIDFPFPYIYVTSSEDYDAYAKYFVDELPYTQEEIKAMADMSLKELMDTAAKLSIEDVKTRHQ